MKTALNFKKKILLGFILMMVSVSGFAKDADKGGNDSSVITERPVNRSIPEVYPETIILSESAHSVMPYELILPGYEGYDLIIDESAVLGPDDECVEWSSSPARAIIIRITARYRGMAILRLAFRANVDGPTIYLDINIEVRR